MEGITSGEGKGWRREQEARERDGGENKWRVEKGGGENKLRGKGMEGRTSGEGKGGGGGGVKLEGERGGWGMRQRKFQTLF